MSAPAHTALSAQQFLTISSMTHVPHLLCPPNLALSNSPLTMSKVLKGKCFATVEEVKQKTAEAPKGIKIDEFKNCLEQWENSLNRCTASNGEYFEGD